jgi:tRNA 5-methylaminomethyl-2-thiouridine biosynthesis bifunctional protein
LSDARSHGAVSGAVEGLLRLCDDSLEAMRARLDVQGLPADWVAPIDAATASRMSGAAIDRPCWYFPRAGWIGPRALSRLLLRRGGITFVGAAAVAKVERLGDDWVARAIDGAVVARGRACVLANAEQAAVLAPWARWPLQTSRGQSTCVDAGAPGLVAPCLPLGSNGYALTLPDGRVLCGASAHRGDPHALPRATDTLDNLDKLARLTGGRPAVDAASTLDRVAWRCRTPDRMPIVGAVPAIDPSAAWPGATRSRHVPREAGLYVLTALGSRGLTLAPLMGEVVAAAMLREPIPLPASLLDAIDPARFVAGARRGPPVESAVAA